MDKLLEKHVARYRQAMDDYNEVLKLQFKLVYMRDQVTEDEYSNIPSPALEVFNSYSTKMMQGGTLIGFCIVGPIVALASRNRVRVPTLSRACNQLSVVGMGGAIVGSCLGPAFAYLEIKDESPEDVYQRAYKLRKDSSQALVDMASFTGLPLGAAFAHILLRTRMQRAWLFGGVLGISVGIVGVSIYNYSGAHSLPNLNQSAFENYKERWFATKNEPNTSEESAEQLTTDNDATIVPTEDQMNTDSETIVTSEDHLNTMDFVAVSCDNNGTESEKTKQLRDG